MLFKQTYQLICHVVKEAKKEKDRIRCEIIITEFNQDQLKNMPIAKDNDDVI